jgi:glutamine amidotransferase
MIVIVDYGMGNLRSVVKGFQKVGIEAAITSSPKDIDNAHAVVLPGVGAFRECMKNLTNLSLIDAVVRSIHKGKPYLGICLGLQILFSEAEEFGVCQGLDICAGRVVKFQFNGFDGKIPHMGWNTVSFRHKPPIMDDIPDKAYFYFVHSYYVVPDDRNIIATETDYGFPFTSMIWKDNIFATQFHPEKSQGLGLKVLTGFGNFVKKA